MQQERDLIAGTTQAYHKCLCGSSLTPTETSWILRYVSLRRFHYILIFLDTAMAM